MKKATQSDRIKAAARLGNGAKSEKVKALIISGDCDDHPNVRAIVDSREISEMSSSQIFRLRSLYNLT